jgi:hypothetical protein
MLGQLKLGQVFQGRVSITGGNIMATKKKAAKKAAKKKR